MCVCVYIYIYNYYTSFTCQGIIQFLHVSEPRLYISNKKKSRNQLAKSLITKHNSPKRTPTLWCRLDDPNKRISLQNHLLLLICSHERKFKIIIDTNHMEQNDNYARHTQTSHQLFNNSNQLCSKWSMHLTQLSNATWYHLKENNLSVSLWHSHLGKLDSHCWGHPVMHRPFLPCWSTWVSREFQTQWNTPQVPGFFPMKNH